MGPYTHMFLALWFPWLLNRDLFPRPCLFLVFWFFTGVVALIGITFILQNICEYEDHCNVPASNQFIQNQILNPHPAGGSFSSSELPGFVCLYWISQLFSARADTLFTESRVDYVDWRGAVNARADEGNGTARNGTWKNDGTISTGVNYLPMDVERPWVNGLAASVCLPSSNGTLNKLWRSSDRQRALGGEEIPWCPKWSPAEWRAAPKSRPIPPCWTQPWAHHKRRDEHGQVVVSKVPVENSTYYHWWMDVYCYKVQRCPAFVTAFPSALALAGVAVFRRHPRDQ